MEPVTHLYIHIPYCRSRCDYCDFFSTADGTGTAVRYLEALRKELEASSGILGSLGSAYIGGGTPSLMGESFLVELLALVRGFTLEGAEVTMEVNPESADYALARSVADAGVSRVSLGVQSFDPVLRRNLGRRGDVTSIYEAVRSFRRAGIDNLSLDLLFAIPEEVQAQLEADIDEVLALAPEHISCYELTIGDSAPYAEKWGTELDRSRSLARDYYELVSRRLELAGFGWYETSNFAREGFECRHNLACWRGEDYLGIGAGAWSTVGGRRWRNCEDRDAYIVDFRQGRYEERLDSHKKAVEALMLGLRTTAGVDLSRVESVIDASELAFLAENGFIELDGAKILLTRAGRFVANEVCTRLMKDRSGHEAG